MSETALRLKQEFEVHSIVSFEYVEYKSDFIFKSEYHDYWKLLYVEEGSCEITRSREKEAPIILKQGELFLQAPNEYYSFKASVGATPLLFSIGFECVSDHLGLLSNRVFRCQEQEQYLLSLLSTEGKLAFSTRYDTSGTCYLDRKYNQPMGGEQLLGIYLEMLLISIIRQSAAPSDIEKEPALSSLSRSDSILLNRITDYYASHITERISIEQLCQEFDIGRSHLQRIFRTQTGLGAIEYFCHMRVSMAKQMIQENQMTLTEISQALGYQSIHYFSKQFKKITGMPPSEYQNSTRSAKNDPLCQRIDPASHAPVIATDSVDTAHSLS